MCSDSLKAKEAITAQEIERPLTDEEAQKLTEFEAHIRRSINLTNLHLVTITN